MTSRRLPLLLIAVLALVSVLALTACSDDSETTPTPTPVPTATPTQTPTPTAAPTPSPTPVPTTAPTVTLPDPTKEPIIFSELPWESAQLQNRIAQYVIEYGYGHPTGVVSGSIPSLFEGLQRGYIDVTMEVWLPSQELEWDKARSEGQVLDVGQSLGSSWQSAFVIPAYLQEQYPDLDSVEDLRDPQFIRLFQTAESGDKARLVSCVINWDCERTNAAQIAGYGLEDHVHVVNPGSEAALNADLHAAYERGEPWLGYQWSTNDPALKLELVRLEEPAYSDECWSTTKACAYEDATILIAVNPGLLLKASDVVEMLGKWDFDIDAYKAIAKWQGATGVTDPTAGAIWWLESNLEIWSEWVTAAAAANVQAALDHGETAAGWSRVITTPTPTATPIPVPTPTPEHTPAEGVCRVGLIVGPGESCTYPGTSVEFSVDSSGRGQFLFFTAGTGIDARNTTVNGVTYNFKASKQDDGTWIIEAAGGGATAQSTPTPAPTPSGTVASDRAALVALYNATDGPNWHNNTNWLSNKPLGEWHGVTTDGDGRVLQLILANNQLSGELPPELGSLSNLTSLYLSDNQLTGAIPPELGNLSNLTSLELGNSQLSGNIPPELGSLSNLRYLKLDYSKLTGHIPPELGSLSNLELLALGGNQLSGSIPPELGSLSNLDWLGLELNQLSGEIPPEFGNLSNLTSLWLQGAGQLSGAIPSELGNLPNLGDLFLAGNRHLAACLPEEARVLHATLSPYRTDIDLLPDCTGMEVVLTTNEEPLIYNDNVFVLPVVEDLTAGHLQLKDYAARFYEYFHDDFDFLIFVSNLSLFNHNPHNPSWWKPEYHGRYHNVMNDVQGIGKEVFSRNREWGSEDALQGTIHLAYSGSFSIGPALHELMHRWGNNIVQTGFGPHWGYSSANGQLGGFDVAELVDHGGDRYSVGSSEPAPSGWRIHTEPYSPIELYLAGLIPPEEVPDLWVAEDAEWLDEYTDDGHQIFKASTVRTYTIEDIIAEHGERIPDSSQSQNDFRAAAILLIDENHPAIKWQLDKVSGHVSSFSLAGADEFDDTYNFYEATGGRARIIMNGLSQFLKDR